MNCESSHCKRRGHKPNTALFIVDGKRFCQQCCPIKKSVPENWIMPIYIRFMVRHINDDGTIVYYDPPTDIFEDS